MDDERRDRTARLIPRPVTLWLRTLCQARDLDVTGHTNERHPGIGHTVVPISPANHVGSAPVAPGHRLVDDSDRRSHAIVLRPKRAPPNDPDAEAIEVPGR